MERIFPYCLLIGVVLLATSAVAAAESKGCTLQGSWMSTTGDFKSLTTDIGQSVSSGTIILELSGFDATLGGSFPKAVKITSLRGVWERTGGNTFAYTQVWYALNTAGDIEWVGRNSGTKTLSADCNQMTVESTTQFFLPGDDNFENPLLPEPVQVDDIYYHRITVDPPASI